MRLCTRTWLADKVVVVSRTRGVTGLPGTARPRNSFPSLSWTPWFPMLNDSFGDMQLCILCV